MEEKTISRVSKDFGVSTRMLRYYEQEGLIKSFRRGDYAYRMYDEDSLLRLQQILILRKLRIPLKQIKGILQKPDAVTAIEIFQKNIGELDEEIGALSAIQSILARFVEELQKAADLQLHRLITEDQAILASMESLSRISINFREDQSMEKLNNAEQTLSKLNDVRIVYLPPATVAAAHFIGDEPEREVDERLSAFVRETMLYKVKPDLRHYGFNHPNPVDETGYHGYEMWVTTPADMEVSEGLVKKRFEGGLYAAHMIPMGNFNEWGWLFDWVAKSDKYDFAGDLKDQEHMCGLLEEHLNYVNHVQLDGGEPEDMQLDLLMPVREHQAE